jgi:hypothetical protein
MTTEIPSYAMRAYALFYTKYGSREKFTQSALDWIAGTSMKKKIFSVLVKAGWIKKATRSTYQCVEPATAIKSLLDFKVPHTIKQATKPYAFTGMSAIEIWSDFSYMQRGWEHSPYFIKILKKDISYWKDFFNKKSIPNYIEKGSTVGEFVILSPVKNLTAEMKDGFQVETLKTTMNLAKENDLFTYAYNYMKKKYGSNAA